MRNKTAVYAKPSRRLLGINTTLLTISVVLSSGSILRWAMQKKTWTHQCIPATHSSSIWLEGYSTFIWGVKPSKAKLHFGFLCPKNLISHNISFLASKRLKCSAHLATSARCGTTRHNWRKAADPSPDVSLAAASKLDRRAATWLVVGGWWLNHPPEKYARQNGFIFPQWAQVSWKEHIFKTTT